jgi:phosphoheptose isomerase
MKSMFSVGDRVTYYPTRKSADDNTHFEAEIVGHSRTGRPRIEFEALGIGKRKLTVTQRSLMRQESLPL